MTGGGRGSGAKIERLWSDLCALENYATVRAAFEQMKPPTQVGRTDLQRRIERLKEWESLRSIRLAELRRPGRILIPLISRHNRACYRLLAFDEDRRGEFWQESMDTTFRGAVASGYRAILNRIGGELDVPLPSPQINYRCRVLPMADCGDPDVELTDRSVALPAAVAFFSAWTALPIPDGIVMTGDVDPNSGRIKPVRSVDTKLQALLDETPNRWLKRYFVPACDAEGFARLRAAFPQTEITAVGTIEEVLAHLWSDWRGRIVVPAPVLEQSFDDADDDYKNHRYEDALPIYRKLVELTQDRPRDIKLHYMSQWRCGATLTHLGRWRAAGKHLRRARKFGPLLRAERVISNADYIGLINNVAHLLTDAYRFEEALALVDDAIVRCEDDEESLEILGRACGTRGLIGFMAGRDVETIKYLNRAIDCFARIGAEDELPRDYCWLGIAYAHVGQRGEGFEAIRLGNDILRRNHADANRRKVTQQFLDYAMVCLEALTGSAASTRIAADRALTGIGEQPYWLAPMVHRYLAESLLANSLPDEALIETAAANTLFDQLGVTSSRPDRSLLSLYPLAAKTRLTAALVQYARHEEAAAEQEIAVAAGLLRRFRPAGRFFRPYLSQLTNHAHGNDSWHTVNEIVAKIRY
jgi:tetratricopeptide (TPR) repeat protein